MKQCNFNLAGGAATGTYRFKTGFYGLTDMPAEFQKAIDCTLTGLTNTFCFLDDIFIASRGTKEEHLKLVDACLSKIETENLAISLRKFCFIGLLFMCFGFVAQPVIKINQCRLVHFKFYSMHGRVSLLASGTR